MVKAGYGPVENSSTESGADPLLICGAGGQWQVIKPCLCDPGYQLDSSQDQCLDTYLTMFLSINLNMTV